MTEGHCAHIHVFYELDKQFALDIGIHVANRISVSLRIEGMSLVVFAIFRLLQSTKFSARF